MRYALIALFLLLPSCATFDSLQKVAATTAELAAKTTEVLENAKAVLTNTTTALAEHKAKADVDGDGKTTSDEWLNYLLGLLGVGGGGLALFIRNLVRNAKSDGRKDVIEARLATLEK